MTRFEIIYHPEPHPSRQGKRFTVVADGHVFLADDPLDAVKACAAFLADLDKTAARASIDALPLAMAVALRATERAMEGSR